MYEVKTELVVKYNTIMDMAKYIRTIISPYSGLVKNISFERVNHPSEIFKLNFVEEKVLITLDWNILRGITIGKTTGLDRHNERFKDLYDLYSKITQIKTFNQVEYVKLITYDVIKDKFYDSVTFKKNFTSESQLINDFGNEDIGLVLEGNDKEESIKHSITFGPLDIDKDNQNHDFNLFDINLFKDDEDLKGCLVRCELTKDTNTFSNMVLEELLRYKFEIIQMIEKNELD